MAYAIERVDERVTMVRCDRIPGCMTNSYVVDGRAAVYFIDSGLGDGTAAKMAELADPKKPWYLINTHYHWDHVWGNEGLMRAALICHERCDEAVRERWDQMLEKNGRYIDGAAAYRAPDVLFNGSLRLHGELELAFAPGHTADSIVAYYGPSRALFAGDIVGDDDTEIVPSVMDPERFVPSLDRCLAFEPEIVLSGHNDPRGPETLRLVRTLYLEARR